MRASAVARLLVAEGTHPASVLRAADFRGRRVLQVGCGDGRPTRGIAPLAASLCAFDLLEESVEAAHREGPAALHDKVRFDVAQADEIEVPPISEHMFSARCADYPPGSRRP